MLDRVDRTQAVAESELPVRLPELEDFKPTGKPEPPLCKAKDWVRYSEKLTAARPTRCPSGPARAGTICDIIDPKNEKLPWDPEKERYWLPVDLYIGGAEHAVLHLLYSRFWHKVLFDRGLVSTAEPFQKLVNQGMILGETEYTGYRDDDGRLGASGRERGGRASSPVKLSRETRSSRKAMVSCWRRSPEFASRRGRYKMSKARGNVINPDDDRRGIRRGQPETLRDVHGSARSRQALEHEGRRRGLPLSGQGLADDRRRRGRCRAA